MPAFDFQNPLLINTLGHTTGILVFAVFIYLFLLVRRNRPLNRNCMPVVAAALALLWNLGSLLTLGETGAQARTSLVTAASFSVLSILPAVLLHLSLGGKFRPLWMVGYAVSSAAVVLHLFELRNPGELLHELAILSITIGFGALSVLSGILVSRDPQVRPRGAASRVFAAMCLFLLAISFVHFSPDHRHDVWSFELAIHHAGIPLALLVLLQDYRFLLLDAFTRVLVNGILAVGATYAAFAANRRFDLLERLAVDPFSQALLVVTAAALLVSFAWASKLLQNTVTRILFKPGDQDWALERIRKAGSMPSEDGFLEQVAAIMAEFAGSADFAARKELAVSKPGPGYPTIVTEQEALGLTDADSQWAELAVPLNFSRGDSCCVLLGSRPGGRPYVSADLNALAWLARAAEEQVERFREQRMRQLISEAEMRALRSQINPHFLFNALNAILGTIPRAASDARRIILSLADVLRYSLRTEKKFVRLSEELEIVRAYLEIESLRLGPRLRIVFDVEDEALPAEIPALTIQPLVENAVKHGVAAKAGPGTVTLRVHRMEDRLHVEVGDTGGGFPTEASPRGASEGGGIGLENVRQRLKLCYGAEYDIGISSGPQGAVVRFDVPQSPVHISDDSKGSQGAVHPLVR